MLTFSLGRVRKYKRNLNTADPFPVESFPFESLFESLLNSLLNPTLNIVAFEPNTITNNGHIALNITFVTNNTSNMWDLPCNIKPIKI